MRDLEPYRGPRQQKVAACRSQRFPATRLQAFLMKLQIKSGGAGVVGLAKRHQAARGMKNMAAQGRAASAKSENGDVKPSQEGTSHVHFLTQNEPKVIEKKQIMKNEPNFNARI
jgi:hypothetical protein